MCAQRRAAVHAHAHAQAQAQAQAQTQACAQRKPAGCVRPSARAAASGPPDETRRAPTQVTNMYSKWSQCASHAISFDRLSDGSTSVEEEPYTAHLVVLFTQLSTLAMLKLHSGEPSEADWEALGAAQAGFMKNWQKSRFGTLCSFKRSSAASNKRASRPQRPNHVLDELAPAPPRRKAFCFSSPPPSPPSPPSPLQDGSRAASSRDAPSSAKSDGGGSFANGGYAGQRMNRRMSRVEQMVQFLPGLTNGGRRPSLLSTSIAQQRDGHLFTFDELEALRAAACPVQLTSHRIHRVLTTRAHARGWRAPAPVFNRVYAELTEGIFEFNAALKLKAVPVPFGFVQLNAILLLCMTILTVRAARRHSSVPAEYRHSDRHSDRHSGRRACAAARAACGMGLGRGMGVWNGRVEWACGMILGRGMGGWNGRVGWALGARAWAGRLH